MRAAPLLLALLLRLRPAAAALDPGPHCPPDQACVALYNDTGLDYYYKVHGVKLEIKLSGNDYMLTCSENVTLDSEALPRFDEHKTFSTVKLAKCRLPARGLSAALAALRVRPLARLQLLRVPPAAALAAAHLAGLAVRELQLEADDDLAALRAEPGFLGPLPALVDLWLKRVALPPAAVLELPAGLKALTLIDVGLAELPRAALARLPELRRLTLERASLTAAPDLSASPKLAELTLDAPVDGVTLGPALRRLDLRNAADATLRGDCGALERLRVSGVARALPADWLRRCGRLAELRLEALPPGELAADVLRGAAWLTKLVVRNDSVCCVTPQRCSRACVGLRLAPRLLEDAAALRVLDLADSGLANITGELFGATKKLEELILSTNNLTADMVDDLSQFKSLKRLNLARNPLGDLCRSTKNYISNGVSPLRDMTALTELQLQETRATRICRDWRLQLASLEKLDLRYNNINYLEYEDLQWTRAERLTVDLDGNNITAVIYSEQQYSLPDSATTPPVYWFARAIQEARATGGRGHALAAVRCRAPDEPLTRMRPALLQCALPAEQCAPKCACAVTGRATVLRCERAGLASLPRLSAPPLPVRELYLAGNNITDPRAEDLPPNLEMLDLSDNGIEKLEADEARELLTRVTGRVELRGNRLACGCGQRGALRVLTAHAARLGDAMCSDGRALLTLAPDELCDATILAAASAGVALLLLAVVVLVCLSRRSVTARIKKFLLDHNLCLSWLLRPRDEYVEDEEGVRYDYDAFVSFSHHDEKFVTEELVPGLEGGARGRRLCLHYRDWTPGAWIPAQIEWSVRRSRHTVVVLSDSFARSSWTRAEFREAHAAALRDARPRLVVVLLADSPDALAPLLDAELRAFLAANTYLRRGDPWFWTKLLRAVSRGRARLPLPADPPPPPPPLAPPPPHLAPPPPHLAPPPPHLAPPPPPQHVPPAAAPPAPPAAA